MLSPIFLKTQKMEIRFNKSDSLIFKGLRIWTTKHQCTIVVVNWSGRLNMNSASI